VDNVAVIVAEHLDFDVSRVGDVFLKVDAAVFERGLGLGAGHVVSVEEFVLTVSDAHATPAATCRGLDQHRITDPPGFFDRSLFVFDQALAAGRDRDARGLHRSLGLRFVAHYPDDFGRRADESDVAFAADLGEMRILGEKSVSGMNRVNVEDFGGSDDLRDVQVALRRRRRPDAPSLVRELDVQGVAVGLGMHGDGFDAEFTTGQDDPAGDFTTIGDKDFFEHMMAGSRKRGMGSGKLNSPHSPLPTPYSRLDLDSEQWLAVFDRLAVFHKDLGDSSAGVGWN